MSGQFIYSQTPILAVLIPIIFALLIALAGEKNRRLRMLASVAGPFTAFLLVASMAKPALEGAVTFYEVPLSRVSPVLTLDFSVDPLGELFALLVSSLGLLITIYSIGYMKRVKSKNETRFFFILSIIMACGIGLAYAGNLYTFFIFYEILAISMYPLLIHDETKKARAAGRRYLFYSLTGGALILGSTIMTYLLSGTLDFMPTGILAGKATRATLYLLFLTFILGFGVKSALVPLHSWLPSSMAAPTPVNALLSVIEMGVFGIARVVYNVYGIELMKELNLGVPLSIIASITILFASVYALKQSNLKQRLAYSSIAELSYIVLGIGLLTESGGIGAMVHIAHHGIMKSALFFSAGTIFISTKKEDISELKGLGKQLPLTMIVFTISALGVIGFPLTAGFITKWYLFLGSLEADTLVFLVVLLISSFLGATYYLPIMYNAFLLEQEGREKYTEPSFIILMMAVITAILIVVLGAMPGLQFSPLSFSKAMIRILFPN